MRNKTIIEKIFIILKKKFFLILIMIVVSGVLAYYISSNFLEKKYEAHALLVYRVKDTSSQEEVVAKNLLLKTYKRIIMSSENLLNTVELINKKSNSNLKVAELKNTLQISQEQDELVLNIKLQSNTYKAAVEQITLFSNSSIAMLQQFNDVKDEMGVINTGIKDPKPISPNIKALTIIGSMTGFMISVAIVLISNQIKRKGDINDKS
ncbi:hypothetical protein HRD78_12420 [Enterococcus faecalis]|nr:hypothetical protein [Enterococcus faecalis]